MLTHTPTERKESLAKETAFSLQQLTKYELQIMAKNLITIRGKNKQQLIDELLAISEGYRAEMLARAATTLALLQDSEFDSRFFTRCFDAEKSPTEVAEIVVKAWQGEGLATSTIAKSKPKQLKASLEILKAENVQSIEWANQLFDEVRGLVRVSSEETNTVYARKVEDYGTPETMLEIEGDRVIDWAERTLQIYVNNAPEKGWHMASLALALTSGRRMDELHGTCKFSLADNNCLKSEGLSKKPDENSALISPCLIDNNLWITAYNHLPESRKGLDNNKVNQTISSSISATLKNRVYPILGINQYKDSRDFYVAYLLKNTWDSAKHGSQLNYAKKLLGHDSKKVTLSYEKIRIV
jgi:hypothetical protein